MTSKYFMVVWTIGGVQDSAVFEALTKGEAMRTFWFFWSPKLEGEIENVEAWEWED